jgi:hypothetical protein
VGEPVKRRRYAYQVELNIMQPSEAERTFEIGAKDPKSWLAQARKLKTSANLIRTELQNEIPVMLVPIGTDERFFGSVEILHDVEWYGY